MVLFVLLVNFEVGFIGGFLLIDKEIDFIKFVVVVVECRKKDKEDFV